MILTALISSSITLTGLLVFFLVAYSASKRKISRIISDFVTSPAPDQPSPFAATVDNVAIVFSQRITASMKSTFMGMQSGELRGERALAGDIAADVAGQQSPILSTIMTSFPAVRKRLIKNPELAGMAMELVSKLGKGKNGGNGQASNESRFQL